MLVFQEYLWQFFQNVSKDSTALKALQLLPLMLIVGQLILSCSRSFQQITFSSYGLSFHSRYLANINFMTNAVGVIQNGYAKVLNPIQTRRPPSFWMLRSYSAQRRLSNFLGRTQTSLFYPPQPYKS